MILIAMNRVDRLFAILLLLQRKRHIRAMDLAQAFEVSERTIYRDMEALSESGVPIYGTPGEGYELVEGYFLPPLLFTPSEASALFLGARLLIANTVGQVPRDAEQALNKIAVALLRDVRAEVDRLTHILSFFGTGQRFDLYEPHLAALQQAIRERRVVRLRYHSYSHDETTERALEPYQLFYLNGSWHVGGFCRLRQDVRDFRLNRIDSLELTDEHFELRDVKPQERVVFHARVRFAGSIVRWVRERQFYGYDCEEPVPGGDDVVMRYWMNSLTEIVPWLLAWGASAEPLEPPELRELVRQEALRIAEQLASAHQPA
jgi:predicted DNA-binding transcriptional regulator YafY